MAYRMKEKEGSVFKNKRKRRETDPDITGKAMLEGQLFYINGWRNVTAGGEGWYKLSFKAADEQAQVDPETGDGQADDPGF